MVGMKTITKNERARAAGYSVAMADAARGISTPVSARDNVFWAAGVAEAKAALEVRFGEDWLSIAAGRAEMGL